MKTILLIEDNMDILDNLNEYLVMEKYKILVASTGKEGVKIAFDNIPDLIVCDVLMHEMSGYEVLRQLLASTKTSRIPFIFSTSLSENRDRIATLKLGADDFITKPYEPELLVQMAQNWISSGTRRSC